MSLPLSQCPGRWRVGRGVVRAGAGVGRDGGLPVPTFGSKPPCGSARNTESLCFRLRARRTTARAGRSQLNRPRHPLPPGPARRRRHSIRDPAPLTRLAKGDSDQQRPFLAGRPQEPESGHCPGQGMPVSPPRAYSESLEILQIIIKSSWQLLFAVRVRRNPSRLHRRPCDESIFHSCSH
jgi:hypothetical protein